MKGKLLGHFEAPRLQGLGLTLKNGCCLPSHKYHFLSLPYFYSSFIASFVKASKGLAQDYSLEV